MDLISRERIRCPSCSSFLVFVLNTVFLLTYHVIVEGAETNAETNDETNAETYGSQPSFDFLAMPVRDMILFAVLVLMAFELLDFCSKNSGKWLQSKEIPVRGKHLDELRPIDIFCIGFAKANTAPFAYFFLRYCWQALPWSLDSITLWNTFIPLPLLFVCFDSTYATLHRILHIQSVYSLIHKHHHIQKAPSRANVDAVNVHPIEFVLGEYNHLLWVYLLHHYVLHIHFVAAILFLGLGGLLAGINHTRYDITVQLFGGVTLFDSKAHDVHHRIPQSNYGQYTMLWDWLLGSYRPYNSKDRVNPDVQLKPRTGKTTQSSFKSQ